MKRVHVHIDELVAPGVPAAAIERAVGRALRARVAATDGGRIASAVAAAVGRAQSPSRAEARRISPAIGGNVPGRKMS
jgi:hypothetical protein